MNGISKIRFSDSRLFAFIRGHFLPLLLHVAGGLGARWRPAARSIICPPARGVASTFAYRDCWAPASGLLSLPRPRCVATTDRGHPWRSLFAMPNFKISELRPAVVGLVLCAVGVQADFQFAGGGEIE